MKERHMIYYRHKFQHLFLVLLLFFIIYVEQMVKRELRDAERVYVNGILQNGLKSFMQIVNMASGQEDNVKLN